MLWIPAKVYDQMPLLCPGTQKHPKLEKHPLLNNLCLQQMHLEAIVWYATIEADRPAVEPTLYGWRRDELNKALVPIGLPDRVAAAPDEVLNMVK